MTSIRRFCCNDLLRFTSIHLGRFTDTAPLSFYFSYLALWPDYFHAAVAPGNRVMAYIVGKVEGEGIHWHGHVTAVTVAPEYRRQGVATKLMEMFAYHRDLYDNTNFVDLIVDVNNIPAITLLEKLGYEVFGLMPDFYSEDEDAFDMRKTLTRGFLNLVPPN